MTLIDILREAVELKLRGMVREDRSHSTAYGPKVTMPQASISELGKRIANELVREAFANGLDVQWSLEGTKAGSGSTAMEVGHITASSSFFYKLDIAEKILDEAKVLRRLAQRDDLPSELRSLFPRVFAVSDSGPVFGYLMEQFSAADGFNSVAETLFLTKTSESVTEQDALRIVESVCDTLFKGYDYRSRDPNQRRQPNFRFRPSIYVDYVERIRDRMAAAALSDSAFISMNVDVATDGNVRRFRPWQQYLDSLRLQRDRVEALAPPFVTFVHGDPNPENVLVRVGVSGTEVRLIDPKEWGDGDYLFDLTKFIHYILVTGPAHSSGAAVTKQTQEVMRIELSLRRPSWANAVEAVVHSRAETFAGEHGDKYWRLRWMLGMASNLLGLPANRLAKGQRTLALASYATGLGYLHDFCVAVERLPLSTVDDKNKPQD